MFWELWMFVAAGLYPHERKYVHIFLPFSIGLFMVGVLMAFFIALPTVLKFLLGFNAYLNTDPQQRMEEFFSFVLFLPLAFGIGFQLPLVMLFVNRIGLISVQTFRKQWRIAILTIFIIAMILTPSPDVGSMSLLALPMTLLYFGGIALCAYTSGRRPAGLGRE
jgi:sec-independent protein translocase protein TatC